MHAGGRFAHLVLVDDLLKDLVLGLEVEVGPAGQPLHPEAPQEYEGVALATSLAVGGHVVGEVSPLVSPGSRSSVGYSLDDPIALVNRRGLVGEACR